MRDTEKHGIGPRSGRSPRFGDSVEQAGIMGKRRAVRRDDRSALEPVSDQIQKIASTLSVYKRTMARHFSEEMLYPAGPPGGSRPAGRGRTASGVSLQMESEPA